MRECFEERAKWPWNGWESLNLLYQKKQAAAFILIRTKNYGL